MITDLILKNRSYRRFDQSARIERTEILSWIDLARLSPFAGNLQSVRYMVFNGDGNDAVLDCLTWKAYLPGDQAPREGEKPAAYIVMLNDPSVLREARVNVGIAAQSILLGAAENGYGGCIIGNIKQKRLRENLCIPEHLEIALVIALGKPTEQVVLESADINDSVNGIKYWVDENQTHHVPKYALTDLIIN